MNPYTVSSSHRLLLNGVPVRFEPPRDKTGNSMPTRRFLVMHFTAGWGLESTIYWWRQAAAKGTSAHLIIDRDGTVVQCRPFNRTCGHAGASSWVDPNTGVKYRNLNSCSIGIEMCNVGVLPRKDYPPAMGEPLGGEDIPYVVARHKNGGPPHKWEQYPYPQLTVATQISEALVARYNLDDVIGHDDIAPSRKTDPGPAFPLDDFRHTLGFPPL